MRHYSSPHRAGILDTYLQENLDSSSNVLLFHKRGLSLVRRNICRKDGLRMQPIKEVQRWKIRVCGIYYTWTGLRPAMWWGEKPKPCLWEPGVGVLLTREAGREGKSQSSSKEKGEFLGPEASCQGRLALSHTETSTSAYLCQPALLLPFPTLQIYVLFWCQVCINTDIMLSVVQI